MPYCRNCGREIDEGNWLCPSCQLQTQPSTPQPQKVIVQQSESSADEVLGAIFLIALIIGGIWFATSVQVFDCPNCHNKNLILKQVIGRME